MATVFVPNATIIHLDKICRSCLTEDGELCSMFDTVESEDVQVTEMLEACGFLQVEEGDELPTQICLQCYTFVQQAYSFKLQCQKSEALIRSYHNEGRNIKVIKIESLMHSEYSPTDLNTDYEEIIMPSEVSNIDTKIKEELPTTEYLPPQCKLCNAEFETASALQKHYFTFHENHENECIKCTKKFKNADILLVHERHCQIHECEVCLKKFRTGGYLQNHMKKHDPAYVPDEKRFKCTECDKCYTSPANLVIHQYSHSGLKPFKCEYCGKGFTKTVALNSHLALHTGKRSHLCSQCGRAFTTITTLNQHKKTHLGIRPFKCTFSECLSSFTAAGDLTIHLRSHTGEKPYLCPHCGRAFSRTTHLNTHVRTHTGERPYVCAQCNRGFAQSGDLRSHERLHTGERPFECNICQKRFVQSSGLSSHMATHSGKKAYQCKICSRKFAQSSSLARHFKSHNFNKLI